MIRNFSDHAANERTFLAWVRTAIAIMAFGFIVERFGLFLEVAAPSIAGRTLAPWDERFSGIVGLSVIVLGVIIVAVSAWRFIATAREIDSEKQFAGTGSRLDLALACLLMLLGVALVLYLSHAFVIKP